jgi:hypothetical protein
MNTCDTCDREFEYVRNKGGTHSRCNSCQTNLRRFKLKTKMIAQLGGKCIRCGYDKCSGALDFHHRDPSTKSFAISGAHCRRWSDIVIELAKCDLICSNCHREHHHDCKSYDCKGL